MHFISAFVDKFASYLLQIKHHNIYFFAGTAYSNGAIWDEFSE